MLTAQVDRLVRNTKAIKAVSSVDRSNAGPFTRAILTADLGDLVRDIDPSELGLLSLVSSDQVSRVEFHGATPLKRRRDDQRIKEIQPEVYAQAALKYIDRFQPIRQMPRAYTQVEAILDQLEAVRDNIQSLTETLEQVQGIEGPSLKSQLDLEEHQIHELQARIDQLKKQKEQLMSSRSAQKSIQAPSSLPITPMKGDDEEQFWKTPIASARTLHFTDNLLMDEEVELGDVSIASIPSPTQNRAAELSLASGDDIDALDTTEDDTVVLVPQPAPATPEPPPIPKTSETPRRMKINMETERIAAKVWGTIADLIKPGHGYDANNRPPRAKETIIYLQSIASLRPVPQSPAYSSSDTSQSTATLVQPTAQQILTAHMLVSLLSSPPHFSISLNKMKTLLSEKAGSDGSGPDGSLVGVLGGPQGTTRVIYACVAKRLLKIERGGGEQVVKFDV
ncbi:hypothetical protein C8J56DRAFT_927756 [Mycena floridula]|nr:hypothetical protein C8J56DRAFT_927756 [Mycena floridula]